MVRNKENQDLGKRRLKVLLNPKRSKLRPYLCLFGVKNYVMLKNGNLVGNNPTIKWYLNHLSRSGITENYWGVRRQLKKLSDLGLFKERKVLRVVENSSNTLNATRIAVNEFYLNEKVYPALLTVLKEIFKVDSLSDLFSTGEPKMEAREKNL